MMNDDTHTYWQGYIRELADMLGLKDWRIILMREEDADLEALGVCYPMDTCKSASIRFGADFWNQSPERKRWVCAHELLHPHFHHVQKLVRLASDKFDENSLMQVLPGLVNDELETGIDAVAEAIAPLLPLPVQYAKYVETGQPVNGLNSIMMPYESSVTVKGNAL